MAATRSLKDITFSGLLVYDSDRPVIVKDLEDIKEIQLLDAARSVDPRNPKNDVFDYCFGPGKWKELDMIMAFRVKIQSNQPIPRYSEYVLKIEGPTDMTLKLVSRKEKFKPDGPFLLHPYFDVIPITNSTQTVCVTYVVLTNAFRFQLLSFPNFYMEN